MEVVKGIIVILGFVCVFTYPIVELIEEIKRVKAIKKEEQHRD